MSSISADFFDSVGQLQLQDFPSELLESILKSEVSETVKDEILASLPETPSLVHLLQEGNISDSLCGYIYLLDDFP